MYFFRVTDFLEVHPTATLFSSKTVHWSQADYLAIAQAYHEYVWGGSWQLEYQLIILQDEL